MAAGSAFSFGVTIVLNRSLAQSRLGVATVLGYRFTIGAAVLLAVLAARRMPLLPAPGERLRVLLLGALGYMFEATLFFMGLERGTACAVSLFFYTYPALIVVAELALRWAPVRRRALAALALSAAGSVLVVAAGTHVSISPVGVVCSLGSAVVFSAYLLISSRLVVRTDSLTTGAWMALGAGASFFLRALVTGALHAPHGHLPALAGNGAATASAFVFMFAAIRRLGPSRTAVVMTMEAFFAIALAAVFLGEAVRPLQAVGGAAILGATALIALSPQSYPSRPDMAPASSGLPKK